METTFGLFGLAAVPLSMVGIAFAIWFVAGEK